MLSIFLKYEASKRPATPSVPKKPFSPLIPPSLYIVLHIRILSLLQVIESIKAFNLLKIESRKVATFAKAERSLESVVVFLKGHFSFSHKHSFNIFDIPKWRTCNGSTENIWYGLIIWCTDTTSKLEKIGRRGWWEIPSKASRATSL